MKIPFLSAKAEEAVVKAVDIGKERVEELARAGGNDLILGVCKVLPLIAAFVVVMSGNKKSGLDDIPRSTITYNYYYYGDRKE